MEQQRFVSHNFRSALLNASDNFRQNVPKTAGIDSWQAQTRHEINSFAYFIISLYTTVVVAKCATMSPKF